MKAKARKNKPVEKKGSMTLDRLALMMGKGFQGVDNRFMGVDKRFNEVDSQFAEVRADIQEVKSDVSMLKSGIEKFIMFYEKQEQEFTIMKHEIQKIKDVLKSRVGVDIDAIR